MHAINPSPGSDLNAAVYQSLKAWDKPDEGSSLLQSLQFVQQHFANAGNWRGATNQALIQALDMMASDVDLDGASLLRARFLNGKQIQQVARQLNMADSTVHRKQTAAIARLAEMLVTLEQRLRTTHQSSLEKRLPTPGYSHLFGKEPYINNLRQQLTTMGPPWLFALHGIGGIGKTTLADALLRSMVNRGELFHLGWVTARQTVFNLGGAIQPIPKPTLTADALVDALVLQLLGDTLGVSTLTGKAAHDALQHLLKEHPHIIVIDNLETLQDVDALLPVLRTLVDPSRFVLTTRQSLFTEPDIYHERVLELHAEDACQLLRSEAAIRNLPDMATADDELLRPIYETVGGNPLALRLIIGQLHIHPLDAVLSDLRDAQGDTVESLYSFIYRQAWDGLDELARNVLLAMPLVPPHGEDLAYLEGVSHIPSHDLRRALDMLVTRNLVDSRGDMFERTYSIHSLTRTFLQKQVAQWHTPSTQT